MTSKRWTNSFDDFFSAFGKSVTADIQLQDGEFVVSASNSLLNEALAVSIASSGNLTLEQLHPTKGSKPPFSGPKPKLRPQENANTATVDTPLPLHLTALTALQASDGSWNFDDKFQYVIQDVATLPPAGISAKLWATAVVVTILRQFPEHFTQLEAAYVKAMLHVDETVLQLAKSHVDVSKEAMAKVRPYHNNAAKEIRERLAREAVDKRAEEDAEEKRLTLERKRAVFISKYSVFQARRLPIQTQELIISSLSAELQTVYPGSTSRGTRPFDLIEMNIRIGDKVECCWRRTDGSRKPKRQENWWFCLVTALNPEMKTVNVLYLDDPFERERHVHQRYVRFDQDDAKNRRSQAFDLLRRSWETPCTLHHERRRLEEENKRQKLQRPWALRSLPGLPKPSSYSSADIANVVTTYHSSRRRLMATPDWIKREYQEMGHEGLHQACVAAALVYDRHLNELQSAVKEASRCYAKSILFQDRFHAFDSFLVKADSLIRRSVEVLKSIDAWARSDSTQLRVFVWRGENFVTAFVRSLDFLSAYKEVVEWYGEDFAFSMNPFLRNESIRDLAEERGLLFTSRFKPLVKENTLRSALKMHKNGHYDASFRNSEIPRWWPESHYDVELRNQINWAEENILSHLIAAGCVVGNGVKEV